MSSVVLPVAGDTHVGLFIIAVLWVIFSGACVVATTNARDRRSSWGWAFSFVAASLVAAYCFGRLL